MKYHRFIQILIFITILISLNIIGHAKAGNTINVASGGDLQAAINNASPGDTIVLEAGATFTGPITLPKKADESYNGLNDKESYITITSSEVSELSENKRVAPDNKRHMATILTPHTSQAIKTEAGAHHYKIIGIEITLKEYTTPLYANYHWFVYDMITLGNGGSPQTTLDSVPSHITLDRDYIHGKTDIEIKETLDQINSTRAADQQLVMGNIFYLKRCIALNSALTDITNSYIADCKAEGQDTQAIAGFNGPGPYNIVNNFLEGAGENIIFGGSDPAIPNLIPSDITIKNNYFYKPVSWRIGDQSNNGSRWTIKNLLELKNAQRLTISNNLFENCWLHAQTGSAIVLKSSNQGGNCPWCVTKNVTFSNNIVRHSAKAIVLSGYGEGGVTGQMTNMRIINNLWEDINPITWGSGNDYAIAVFRTDDTSFEHNTYLNSSNLMIMDSQDNPSTNFNFTNNIAFLGTYGVAGSNYGVGKNAINHYFPGAPFTKNTFVDPKDGAIASNYPDGNYFPASWDDVGFINRAIGDYNLAVSSPYKNAGTDGKDIGVNMAGLIGAYAAGNTNNVVDLDALTLFISASPDTGITGTIITYTIIYTNNSIKNMTNATISNPIPVGTTYVANSASNSGSFNDNTLTWNIGNLAAGASNSITFRVTLN